MRVNKRWHRFKRWQVQKVRLGRYSVLKTKGGVYLVRTTAQLMSIPSFKDIYKAVILH